MEEQPPLKLLSIISKHSAWPVNKPVFKDSDFLDSFTLVLKNIPSDDQAYGHSTVTDEFSKGEHIPLASMRSATVSLPQDYSSPLVGRKLGIDLAGTCELLID